MPALYRYSWPGCPLWHLWTGHWSPYHWILESASLIDNLNCLHASESVLQGSKSWRGEEYEHHLVKCRSYAGILDTWKWSKHPSSFDFHTWRCCPALHSSWHFQERKGVPVLGKGQISPELPKPSHSQINNWWVYWSLIDVKIESI